MAKFYGEIGYATLVETTPGVWKEVIKPIPYQGELVRNHRRLQGTEQANSNITLNNEISIISDPIVMQNFHSIRYVEFMGTKWKATSVDVQYPRLILTMGEVYNG